MSSRIGPKNPEEQHLCKNLLLLKGDTLHARSDETDALAGHEGGGRAESEK